MVYSEKYVVLIPVAVSGRVESLSKALYVVSRVVGSAGSEMTTHISTCPSPSVTLYSGLSISNRDGTKSA